MFPKRISKTATTLAAAVAAFAIMPAFAGPIKDVPAGTKVSAAVASVTSKKLMDAPGGKFNGDKPVTRYELAVTLDRFVRYIENGRKPLHPTKRQHAAKLPASAKGKVRRALTHLTRYYYIGPNSFLLQGKGSELVTAKQLASALSEITVRISDRAVAPQDN